MADDAVDVAVIGAGVAGLSSARALHDAKLEIVVLEARDRIGGRIFTQHDPAVPLPIELGAEFIHGSAPELEEIIEAGQLLAADAVGGRWRATGGRFQPLHDFWERLDGVMRRLDGKREPDRSFREFLDGRPGGRRLSRDRPLALQWVENFHAADPARASERALADGGSPGDDERERRLGRFLGGYDSVPRHLARDLGDRIRFGAVVTRIEWRPKHVTIHIQQPDDSSALLAARAAVVAVPLGVLQAAPSEKGAIAFDPPLDADRLKREALAGMEMGSIVRVVVRVRERFWTGDRFAQRARSEDLDRLAFLHTTDGAFPVWWTTYPIRAPLLVGWVGGLRARALLAFAATRITEAAIASLGEAFGVGEREARRMVEAAWTHDWEHDPYARGAYSYVVVGGDDAPAKLARPLERTLFFAGEASDADGRTGTVHGAIASGVRAARQVQRALGARRGQDRAVRRT